MDNKKSKIIEKISIHLQQFNEIEFAYIFGSFISSENYHDIDIAVYLNEKFDKNDFVKYPYGYESGMNSELSKLTKFRIDFVVMNNAEITLQQRIINKGVSLFCKDRRKRIYYENHIRKLYIDMASIRKIKRKYLSRKITNA